LDEKAGHGGYHLMPSTKIGMEDLIAYLKKRFPDRVHATSKNVSEIIAELSKEGINDIEGLENLVTEYPPDEYVIKLAHESGFRLADVGVIRSLLNARKIDEIKDVIKGWGDLSKVPDMQDRVPFVSIGGMGDEIASYLMKEGSIIKIRTTNEGDLEITNDELGNRIGTGLPYLRRLEARLEEFRLILNENRSLSQ
jgi:hypothetical protein